MCIKWAKYLVVPLTTLRHPRGSVWGGRDVYREWGFVFFCLHYFFYVLYVLSTHHTEHTKCARAVLESVIVIIHCLSLIFTRIALKEMKTDVFLLIFIVVSNDTMLQRGRLCASFHNVFILHIFYVFERVTVSFCFLIRRFQCKYYCTNS